MSEIYSRYRYVRTDTHVFSEVGPCLEIKPFEDQTELEFLRQYRDRLTRTIDVEMACEVLKNSGCGKPRVIMVTVYKHRKK